MKTRDWRPFGWTVVIVFGIVALFSAACPAHAQTLVGHWKFDAPAGGSVIPDSSGSGLTAVLTAGAVTFPDDLGGALGSSNSPAPVNSVLSLNGTSAHAVVAAAPILNTITKGVTLAAWIWRNAETPLWAVVASRQLQTTGGEHYAMSLGQQNRLVLFVTTLSGAKSVTGPVIPLRQWVHVAGTYDGANMRLYLSGAQVAIAPQTGAMAMDTRPFIIGGNTNNAGTIPGELFSGRIDELRLYDGALSEAAVKVLASPLVVPPPPPPPPDPKPQPGQPRMVILSWQHPRTDLTYNVYRGQDECTTMTKIANGVVGNTYTDSGISNGKYCYALTSVDATIGEGSMSGTATAVLLDSPTDLRITIVLPSN